MSGHQAIGRDPDARLRVSLRQDLFKRDIVGRLLKQRQASHPAVQDMIGKATGSDARTTRQVFL